MSFMHGARAVLGHTISDIGYLKVLLSTVLYCSNIGHFTFGPSMFLNITPFNIISVLWSDLLGHSKTSFTKIIVFSKINSVDNGHLPIPKK